VENIEEELRPLVARLRGGIAELGFELLTPASPDYASGIVSFAHAGCKKLGAALQSEGVIVWSGDERVRASVHLYTDADDIERLLDVLGALRRQEAPCMTRS
jgi:selenocysteine lyase/cysteine desulfurase